jgi:hypothetical protein
LKKKKTMETRSKKSSAETGNQTTKVLIRGLRFLFVFLSLVNGTKLTAQPGLMAYLDIAKNNASGGLWVKLAFVGCYSSGKYKFEAGSQVALRNKNELLVSGFTVTMARKLMINRIPLEIKTFVTRKGNSGILSEYNSGLLLGINNKRMEVKLGTNFRTYILSNKIGEKNNIEKAHCRIHENFNLMYAVSYNLRLSDDPWNIGLSIHNFDYFRINQETNPCLSLRGSLKLSPQVFMYAESCQETAGILNRSTNHYGNLLRTGIKWNFN